VPQVRVILADGTSPGIMETKEALKLAREQNLDLIEINPKSIPPVVKIADFGKMQYEEKKKLKEAKKRQQVQEMKEIAFKYQTDPHDLLHKLNQVKDFLTDGHKVRLVVKMRGREVVHADLARDKLNWMLQQLDGLIAPTFPILMEGKVMSIMVMPKSKSN
jgi:translation initiation factor IF-3